jgi:succinate-semialdehyde dehydrogenase/glutarate-semialdehyde dehydrogenase
MNLAGEPQAVTHRIVTLDPATDEILAELDCAGEAEVAAAVASARAAQPAWAAAGVGARVRILRRFQQLLYAKKAQVARLITREAGKPYVEALLTEVLVVLDAVRFCTEQAHSLLRPQPVPHGNLILKAKSARLRREPYGVVGIISPWNYPLAIPATETLAALATGNAVVLKPSEFTPLVALELQTLLHEAGVPEAVSQVLVGDGGTGAQLTSSPIDKLIFTGSVPTGKRVAELAAARLLPVVLELGGKDPMLVLDDADLEAASSAAVWGAFVNAGQACLSVERCYVARPLYEPFVAACAKKTGRLRVDHGLEPEVDVGPLIHQRQLKIVREHVQDAVARGARLVIGGVPLPKIGPNFFAPTVLAGVDHTMRVMREETFGPLLPIMPFDRDEEAIRLANDSEFGLAASIWTRNRRRGEALAARLEAGTVMVNDVVSCFGISEAPHGGFKASGIGRTHGRLGLEEMVRTKYVDSDLLPRLRKVWWYGYGKSFACQMESFLDFLFARGLRARLRGGLRSARALWRKNRL